MKLSKFISPFVATTTIAISTLAFFSIDPVMAAPKVNVVRNCMTYDRTARAVGTLNPGFYTLVRYVRFMRGENGSEIIVPWRNRLFRVGIANRCLQTSRGRVIEY